ncbi:MAG: thiol:disulfide interchange protein DsbA/DsbL [Aquabacterium sp.]|nr:thiol:disulfide interchange protein DsbA/DsbL [Aquabacterium sp.]
MIKRRTFCSFAVPITLSAHTAARAQEQFAEGKHYLGVSPRQPTKDPKQVEVLEFFAYSCSHCNSFEPALEAWLKKLPRDVQFRRVPVAFREDFVIHQQLYIALETLGLVEKLHGKVFHAIHAEKQRLATPGDIADFGSKNGVDGKRLVETMNSFSVAGKIKQATTLAGGYKIEGTPSLGVDGRWLTSGSLAGTNPRSLLVVDHLIALAKKAR